MSLVIVIRNTSPFGALVFERFYPEPLRISSQMLAAIVMMMAGALMYVWELPATNWEGVGWVLLNSALAVVDRLLQRLLLSKDQCPVDISKTGITLINSVVGLLPIGLAIYLKGEYAAFPGAVAVLSPSDKACIGISCIIGLAISYTSMRAQTLISATSFLVMINANKFVVIAIEAFGTCALTLQQTVGASLTILGGVLYGKARQAIEQEAEVKKFLVPKEDYPVLQRTTAEKGTFSS